MSTTEKKPKKKTKVNIVRLVLMSIISICLIVGVIVAGIGLSWIASAEPLDIDAIHNQVQTTTIVDKTGTIIDKLHDNENRTTIKLSTIPKNLQNAFIAIEDKRFATHIGIDFKRIANAFIENITSGDIKSGGSTITQQLIKNVYLTPDKLFKRKVIEIYYALQLERKLTKDQILEAYLNSIDFSGQISGVQEASLYYFAKDVSELTLAECATLAGITNNPSIFSPYANYEKSMKRKTIILNQMLDQGYISQTEHDEAIAEEIVLSKIESDLSTTYFGDMVLNDVINQLIKQKGYTKEEASKFVFNGGLTVTSTVDTRIQAIAEESIQNPKFFPAVKEGTDPATQPEAAVVVMDQYTGEIVAVVGGRNQTGKRELNRATMSTRQPGSSIKPLSVYAPALANGYTAATIINDEKTDFGGGYAPNNADRKFRGLVTLRQCITSSLNIPACKIVQDLGVERSMESLENFGLSTIVKKPIDGSSDATLGALALGGLTKGAIPLEMTAAFAVFPNKGQYIEPHSFTKVVDKNGTIVLEVQPVKRQTISADVAGLMVDLMKNVVSSGTGTRAAISGVQVAGKTGTTDDKKDAWFIGYTPYYTACVWMGHDTPKKMTMSGGGFPAMLWKDIMEKTHKGLPKKSFDIDVNYESSSFCIDSGKAPTELCYLDPRDSRVKTEKFIKGTVPSMDGLCDVHIVCEIDTESKLLANPYCPPTQIESKVFLQNPPVPTEGEGTTGTDTAAHKTPTVTLDPAYMAPTQTCTLHNEITALPPDDILPPDVPPVDEPTTPIDPVVPETPVDGGIDI